MTSSPAAALNDLLGKLGKEQEAAELARIDPLWAEHMVASVSQMSEKQLSFVKTVVQHNLAPSPAYATLENVAKRVDTAHNEQTSALRTSDFLDRLPLQALDTSQRDPVKTI